MNKHFILAVLAIALLSVFASLAPISEAAGAWDKDICPCETATYQFKLSNTQSSAESYYLAVDEFAKQAKFSENPALVEPGKTKIAYAYITPKCDITGDYNFNFLIKNKGKTTKMPASLSIRLCPDFGISFGEMLEPEDKLGFSHHEGKYTICKGDIKKIPVLVINKANMSNNLFFGINGEGAEFASLSQQSAALKEEQKGMISLNLEPDDIGNYSIFFDVTQERGEVKKTYKLNVESEECYELSIDMEEADIEGGAGKICSGETTHHDLKITNEGRFKESFNLSADKEWAGFDSSIIDIEPGEEGIAKLGLAPLVNDTGRYDLEVRASIVGTNVEDNDMISIKVLPRESCYSAKIIANNLYGIDSFGKKIALKIKNTGIKEADFDITLEGPAWASISQNKISLAEGETKGLNIFAKPGTDIAFGAYNASVTLRKDELSYSKNITLELSNQEQILSKLKLYFNYYIYYAITGIVLLIAVLAIVILLKKAVPKQKKPTKEELREKIKKEQRKKAEKKAEQAEQKGEWVSSPFFKVLSIIVPVLVVIGITAGYLFERFNLSDHIKVYLPFIGAGAGLLIIIILTLNFARKRQKKAAEKTEEREQKEKETGAKLKKIEKEAEAKARPEKKEAKEKSHIIEFVQYMLILAVLGAVIYFISRVGGVKSALVYYLNYVVLGFALLVILIMILNKFRRIKGKGGKAKKGEKEAKKEEKIAVKKEDGKAEKGAEKKRPAKPNYLKYLFWSMAVVVLGLFFISYAFHNLMISWLSAPYGYANEFVLLYFKYIIVGFIILAILILLLKYRRKFLDFLMEDDEGKS